MANSDLLKKHHFWFLFIPVCIALLLAWYGLFVEVPDAISGTATKLEEKKKALSGVKAQPKAMIKEYESQVGQLDTQRVKMWQQAWDQQKDVFAWPAGYSKQQLELVKGLKFGDPVPEAASVHEQFEEPYHAEYAKLVEKLKPMDFGGGWERVLRHVPTFSRRPDSEDMWLAMEDLWVQRAVLEAIDQVNVNAARFEVVPPSPGAKDDPKHRVFRSRLWQLDLTLAEKDNKRRLEGTLTNVSNRLQVMGVGNVMRLKVWLTPQAKTPYTFEVQGGAVEAGQTIKIKTLDSHTIPPDWKATELDKVGQQFDVRTVPIKRVEHLALGKMSDRNQQALQLRMSKFSEREAARETAAGAGGGNAGFMGGAGATGFPTPGGITGGPTGTPMPSGIAGGATGTPMPSGIAGGATGFGGGAVGGFQGGDQSAGPNGLTQNKLQRYRYIDVTDQVRRMPLGVSVVTDQSYMKDILEALANIKLRFQITQMHWTRYHNQLNYSTPTTSGTGFPPRGGMTADGESPTTSPGGFPGTYNPFGTAAPTNSREDQFSANLMEMSVYGIVSLYEKYQGEDDAAKAKKPADPVTPPVNPATPPAPAPTSPTPMAPAPPAPPQKK